MNIIKYIFVFTFMVFQIAHANKTEWKQVELTQSFMESITKDQCVIKTISSLKVDNQSETYIKTLAGITGDCVTWASGEMNTFCKSYSANYIRNICSTNTLDARDCVLIHIIHLQSCFSPKY